MYYTIVKASSSEELTHKVNNRIEAGFIPFGGVSVCTFHEDGASEPTTYYDQAMIDNGGVTDDAER